MKDDRRQKAAATGGDELGNGSEQPGLRLRMRGEVRRLSTQHEQLDTFAQMVAAGLERQSLHAARIAFTRFRDALEAHVTLEDRIFFPALRGLRPALDADLADLVRQHDGFRAELEALHDLLASGSAEAFEESFQGFCDSFAEHEAREERILAETSSPQNS